MNGKGSGYSFLRTIGIMLNCNGQLAIKATPKSWAQNAQPSANSTRGFAGVSGPDEDNTKMHLLRRLFRAFLTVKN